MADPPRVRVIPYPNHGGSAPDGDAPRVETGAIQFGNDWPGLFVRGDEAFALARRVEVVGRFLASLPPGAGWEVGTAMAALADLAAVIRRDVVVTPSVGVPSPGVRPRYRLGSGERGA